MPVALLKFICSMSVGHTVVELGHELNNGQTLQCVVPAGSWFAMAPQGSAVYSLIGCTVSPGFDFADFELASAKVAPAGVPWARGSASVQISNPERREAAESVLKAEHP